MCETVNYIKALGCDRYEVPPIISNGCKINNVKINNKNVIINITSFTAYTIYAKHYYCDILLNNKIRLRLYRPLTESDFESLDGFGGFRYDRRYYKEGDYVESFYAIKDIISLLKKAIEKRFDGDWIFVLNSWGEENNIFGKMESSVLKISEKYEERE